MTHQHLAPGSSRLDRVAGGGLLAAATGIMVQYFSGVDLPTIPPGPIILAVAPGIVLLSPWPWRSAIGGALVVALTAAVAAVRHRRAVVAR